MDFLNYLYLMQGETIAVNVHNSLYSSHIFLLGICGEANGSAPFSVSLSLN